MSWFAARSALLIHRTVIVHTRDDRSFVGVLIAVYPEEVVLRHARMLPDGGMIGGDVVVPRDNVGWIQTNMPDSILPKEPDA